MRTITIPALIAALFALGACGQMQGGGASQSPEISALGAETGTEIDPESTEAPGGTDGQQDSGTGDAAGL